MLFYKCTSENAVDLRVWISEEDETWKKTSETRFFSVCWLGKFEDFRSLPCNFSHLELLALSSWTQVAGTPEHPRNQQIFRVPSEFLPSSFRKSINSVHPKGTPQISPRLASLLAILPWTRHLCRPCHIASNSQPLPAHRRTVPLSLSLVKGTDTWNWALCCHHLTGLNFLEMLYQFILRGAVVLQFAIKKSF